MKSKRALSSTQQTTATIVPTLQEALTSKQDSDQIGENPKTQPENRTDVPTSKRFQKKASPFRHVWPTSSSGIYYGPANGHEPIVKTITLTPQLAETWRASTLAVETRIGHRLNRNANLKRIDALAEMMLNDQFPFVGDSIKLSPKDEVTGEPVILDGWHRICAVIKTQKPLKIVAVLDLDPSLFSYIDIGRNRSVADLLVVNGFTSQKFLSAAARCVFLFEQRESSSDRIISNPEILDTIARHKGLAHWVDEIRKCEKPFQHGGIAASCYWLKATNDSRVDQFIEELLSGTGLVAGSPILALRRRIVNEPELKRVALYTRMRLPGLIFLTWHYFIQNESPKQIQISREIQWPGGAPYQIR